MAYSDFTLPALSQQFSLTIDETPDLFAAVPETTLRPEFQARLDIMVPFALDPSTVKSMAPTSSKRWRPVEPIAGVSMS